MNRLIIILSLALLQLLAVIVPGIGQESPYQFNFKEDAAIIGIGGLSLGIGHYLRSNMEPLTVEEIQGLQEEDLINIDQLAVEQNSIKAYHASNYFLRASYALPLLFLAEKQARHDFPKIALLYAETMLLNSSMTLIVKSAVQRPRPFVYNQDASLESKQSLHARSSFFSGHTSNVAANTFFAARVFSDYYPDSKWKPVVWGIAATAPAITGYLRVKAGKHYPSDIVVGYVAGGLIGFFIPKFHKKKQNWKVYGSLGGAALQVNF